MKRGRERRFCHSQALHRAGKMDGGIRGPLAPLEAHFHADIDAALDAAGVARH